MTTYKDSGVDIHAADHIIRTLSPKIESTFIEGVKGRIGGFASLFDLGPGDNIFGTYLTTTTDGVGTKLKIAFLTGIHNTVGIDLVAMNVNDILVSGSTPILFMDYFSTSKLDPAVFEAVLDGICVGCKEAGCALVGGETAEMPGFYQDGEYDLAGFCVGLNDDYDLIDGSKVKVGNVVIGLESSGLHSNGYSLVRKVFLDGGTDLLGRYYPELGKTLGQELLIPTRIYVKPVLDVRRAVPQHGLTAMAHITGGGFTGNIPRVIPDNLSVSIQTGSWTVPPIFNLIQHLANLDDSAMFETFNMGVGFVIISEMWAADVITEKLLTHGVNSWIIGEVVRGEEQRLIIA
jgi:phosphoribosylformylglycinamidine cyclo-ligase